MPVHGHVVNVNNVGVFAERNAKKIGKVKIQENEAKKEEALAPKGKQGWYGKLDGQKAKEIFNTRVSKEERKKRLNKYIFEGQ